MANPSDPMFAYSWYHGGISRPEAEEILNKKERPGLFMVRDSKTMKGDYVLCVREIGKVSHYIINYRNKTYKIGDQTFDDLPSIVEFYKKHFLDTTTLQEPAVRPGFEEQVKQDGAPEPEAPKQQPPPPESLKVRAKYNFVGNDPEDLSFRKGDILTVLKKEEDQWWLARHSSGKEGLIPVPYVEVLQPGQPPNRNEKRETMPPNRPPFESRLNQGRTSLGGIDYARPQIKSMPPDFRDTRQPEPAPQPLPAGPLIAVAVQSREPSFYDKEQLKFQKGDKIKVLNRREDGMWKGEKLSDGTTGLFPFNFVEVLREQP